MSWVGSLPWHQVSGDGELLNPHLCLPWSGQVLLRFLCAATTSPTNSSSPKIGRIRSSRQLSESLRACVIPGPKGTPRSLPGAEWSVLRGGGPHSFYGFTAPDYISHRLLQSGRISLGLHFPKATGVTRASAFPSGGFVTVGAAASLEVWEGKVNTQPHQEGTADSDPAHKAASTCVKENSGCRACEEGPAGAARVPNACVCWSGGVRAGACVVRPRAVPGGGWGVGEGRATVSRVLGSCCLLPLSSRQQVVCPRQPVARGR